MLTAVLWHFSIMTGPLGNSEFCFPQISMYSRETKVTVPIGTSRQVFIIVKYNGVDVVLKFVILIVVCSC